MILVTGANGQLGFDVIKALNERKIECLGTRREDLDITDAEAVNNYITQLMPSCVIHCAAYTAVDKAEYDREKCHKVNVVGTKNIACVCKKVGSKMVYISTDYVFNGKGQLPLEVDGHIEPLSFYGRTKYEGELTVKEILDNYFIVRTSWVFGVNGNNFVETMIKLGKQKESINVVGDQIGSPTYTVDLAALLCEMVLSEKYGVYHATNDGFCSWADFANKIMKKTGISCKVNPITANEYNSRAIRPLNSRLSKKSLIDGGFHSLPPWEDALNRFLLEISNIERQKKHNKLYLKGKGLRV